MSGSSSALPSKAVGRSHAGWPALVLTACVTAAIVTAGDYRLFFVDFMFPTGDAASNDILITDAKHFALLHGNYSRVGFYHPGPFYFQWMALFEMAFVNGVPIFASPFAAQLFALAVLHASAIGLCLFAWQRLLGHLSLAGLAAAIGVAVTLSLIGENYFIGAWPPYMYIPSALIVASGLVGLVSGDPRWLPVLLLGLLQLVHGHASFIGLAPVMLLVAIVTSALVGVLPLRTLKPASLAAHARAHSRPLFVSIALVALFLAPPAANTILNWPGEIPKYFSFADSPRSQGPADALKYVGSLVPGHGLWLFAFVLPASLFQLERHIARRLRAASVILAATAGLPGWWYAWRGVDNLDERYLIFWTLPFFGASLAAAVVYVVSCLPRPARVLALGTAAVAIAVVLAPFRPANLDVRRAAIKRESRLTADAARALAREIQPGHRLALQLNGQPNAWTRVWPDVAALMAALHRQGVENVCLERASWHLLFHPRYRCSSGTDVSRLLYITTPERAEPGWRWELPHSVIGPARTPEIGSTAFGNALSESGVVLFGDWSSPESWGVWSTGRRAAFALDASRLPVRFHLDVEVRMFPPPELRPQKAHVVDSAGRPLGTLSNSDLRAPLRLSIDRGHTSDGLVVISFLVDAPVSPLTLGINRDTRELGIGLETITIAE